eukprot:983120-Pleurochrysis_carterae.AAC.1
MRLLFVALDWTIRTCRLAILAQTVIRAASIEQRRHGSRVPSLKELGTIIGCLFLKRGGGPGVSSVIFAEGNAGASCPVSGHLLVVDPQSAFLPPALAGRWSEP